MFRNVLDIAVLYLKMTYSSRSVLIFQLALPILFTYLIGQATSGFGPSGTSSVSVSWDVAVVNEDDGSLGDELIALLDADSTLNMQAMGLDSAIEGVDGDELLAVVVIPAGFTSALESGGDIALDLHSQPEDSQQIQTIEQAINAASSRLIGTVNTVNLSTNVATELGLFETDITEETYRAEGLDQAKTAWETPPVVVVVNEDERITAPESVIPSGIDQSSPGMMAMFATFGMVGGAAVFIQERQAGTLRRLLVMPINKTTIILGKLIGVMTTGIVQMILLIVFGALFFNVAWGNSIPALAIMVFTFALAITSLGMMLASLSRTLAQANAFGTVIVLSISALGGAWWPLDIVPGWMQTVGRFSPISWTMTGFHDIITRQQGVIEILPEAGVLLGFTLVFLAIGLWQFKYE